MGTSTQDVYARAVRRLSTAYDCCPDRLTPDDLREHFSALIDSHSWSTVRTDRAGLQFFFKHVLSKPMDWDTIVKPKRVKSLPDVRARMLAAMKRAGLLPSRPLPQIWVVDCRAIGSGLPALKYLSRYLYRGVISE